MGKKKHPFIDKKTAQRFTLVHRSQRDPLQADEDSAQRVLMPAGGGEQREEQIKHGIYYEDDYNYMQHLRLRGEGELFLADAPEPGFSSVRPGPSGDVDSSDKVSFGNLLLPKEVLPSEYEEDEGMLGKGWLPRGPQPDWDPDIVAALDDALDLDDPDNVLEDDFMVMANDDVMRDVPADDDDDWITDEEGSDVGSQFSDMDSNFDAESNFSQEETKSRFTNYSMTSSVIRRTEELKLLDDRFERIMEEYDEDEIGCIDHEEVTGALTADTDLFNQAVEQFEEQQKMHQLAEAYESDHEKKVAEEHDSEEESDEKLFAQFHKEPKEQWDCESIISTYSNLYNHPKLIVEEKKPKPIKLSAKTGLPEGVLRSKEKRENDDIDNDSCEVDVTLHNQRNKNETPEERRLRKQAVKEHKKNRRVEKKTNKIMFKQEQLKQERVMSNSVAQQGIKF